MGLLEYAALYCLAVTVVLLFNYGASVASGNHEDACRDEGWDGVYGQAPCPTTP